jgi:radical SAM protein with 4Fe4S-binding SPASM domain
MFSEIKQKIKKKRSLYVFLRNVDGLKKGAIGLTKGKRGSKDHLKSTISLIRRSNKIAGKPMHITIEPTNICNAKCPVCETGAGILERKNEMLSFDDFKTIVDKTHQHTNTLMYYFMGEPFLNKEWVKQVRYAKDKGIPFISTCTNGDVKGIPQGIIDSNIDWVSFQTGGTTQETHEVYRVNTSLENARKNIIDTIELKKKHNQKNLTIEAGFILMKHNEHQVVEFRKWCKSVGVDSVNIIDPCVRTVEQGKVYLPTNEGNWIYDQKKFEEGQLQRKIIPKNDCPWIYYSMNVMCNGDVVPCCHDPKGKHLMGNLLEQEFEEIWNGEKFQNFRNRINNNQRNVDICRLCSGYGVSVIK